MKHFIRLWFFVCCLSCVSIEAQQTTLLTDTSNKWYEYGSYGGYYPYPKQNVHVVYYFKGDTIIGAEAYKKLYYLRRDTTYSSPMILNNHTSYSAAFRQDSLKVYFVMKDSTIERLYCDFNLSAGDTLDYYYNSIQVVDTVISVPFGSGSRKRYVLSNGASFYDGIGASHGLFHNYSIGIEGGVYLVCFQQKSIQQTVYDFSGPAPACKLTSLLVTTAPDHAKDKELQIYPNPFNDQIFVNLTNGGKSTIIIYDLTGRQILEQHLNEKVIINADHFEKGAYFYEVRQEEQPVKFGKLLKH